MKRTVISSWSDKMVSLALLLGILFFPELSHAGHEKFTARQAGAEIQIGGAMTVIDDKYSFMTERSNWMSVFNNHRITNKITLAIDPYGAALMNEAFTVYARVQVIYSHWDENTGGFVQSVREEILTINYTLSGPYQDKSTIFIEEGGNHVTVRVIDYYTNPGSLGFVPNVELTAEIDVERYYTFDAEDIPDESTLHIANDPTSLLQRNELLVSWDEMFGAEEYDVEWAWVNNVATDGSVMAPGDIIVEPDLFRLNSTRITTTNNHYYIPMMYEPGYLLVRYRGVARDPDKDYREILPGAWSRDPIRDCNERQLIACWPGRHRFLFGGFSDNFNWQSATTFIEEGKKQAQVSYFDGMLTPRQQQVRVNSKNKIMVGETIYDREGRAAISVLPVPVDKQNLNYTNNFNRNSGGLPYSFDDFESDDEICPEASPMPSSSGASNYYSPQNPNQEGHQAYLPNAHGYPFVQSTFVPDKTSSIRAQSMPGRDHRIGSGHETKYYYGTPSSQAELDRLFGHDVGLVKNYRKNVMVDANGQVHVTYVDPTGKAIATALAGASPETLDPLDNNEDYAVSVDFLPGIETYATDGRSRFFNKSHIVTTQGPHELHYEITSTQFETECELPDNDQSHCYNCVVDVSLSVIDECGNEVLSPLSGESRSVTVGAVSPECVDEVGSFEKDETLTLNVGSYQIAKTVTINQQALDAYTADYLDPERNSCLLTLENFMEEALLEVDTTGCNVTCETCREQVGVFESWEVNAYNEDFNPACDPCLTEEEYITALSRCDEFCDESAPNCTVGLVSMLMDVSPNGQYGGVLSVTDPLVADNGDFNRDIHNADINPSLHELSVFNVSNQLPVPLSWQVPHHYITREAHYYDEDGNIAYVDVLVLSPDANNPDQPRYFPDITESARPDNPIIGSTIQVEPQYLVDVTHFLAFWQGSWAESLVTYHPEWVYYEFCVSRQASHDFDLEWLSASDLSEETYQRFQFDGTVNNLPDPLGDSPSSALDPYFSNDLTVNPSYRWWEYSLMSYFMQHYIENEQVGTLTIWEAAHAAANCPLYETSETSCPNCFDTFNGIDTQEEWIQFRSYYISLKQRIQDYRTRLQAITNARYNGCIGEENFDPGSLNIWNPDEVAFTSPNYELYEHPFQTCNVDRAALFSDKVKRFPTATDMTDIDKKNTECYRELSLELNDNTEFHSVTFPVLDEVSSCEEANRNHIAELEARVDRIIFETCGQCPAARDIQLLLDGVASERVDDGNVTRPSRLALTSADVNPEIDPVNPSFYLSCYPFVSEYGEFTSDLEQALGLEGTDAIVWKQMNLTDKRLDAALQRLGNDSQCTVTLQLPEDSPYNISDLRGICCVFYEDAPQLLPLEPNRNFTLSGVVITGTAEDGRPIYEKVPMEGVSCINIAECPMPPVCDLRPEVESLESIFDALASSGDFVTPQPIEIFSTTRGENEPYATFIRGRLDQGVMLENGTWTWSTIQNGDQLDAFITVNTGASVNFQFFLPPDADIDFDDIIRLENIRANNTTDDLSDAAHLFTINALARRSDGSTTTVRLIGSSTFTLSSCRIVYAPGNTGNETAFIGGN